MKNLIIILSLILATQSFAGQAIPPIFLIKKTIPFSIHRHIEQKQQNVSFEHGSIDFEAIKKNGKGWTKDKIIDFFSKIKVDEIELENPTDFTATTVRMLKPIKATFSFSTHQFKAPGTALDGVSYYRLVKIETEK